MQTPAFEAAFNRAIELARDEPTVWMCAEALPWRCHRLLVADALTVRDIEVREIVSNSVPKEHVLTPFARVTVTKTPGERCYADEPYQRAAEQTDVSPAAARS
jgi:uncharacterized protein (DUF488 family)